MTARRLLTLRGGWLVDWFRDEPFMFLTMGKTSYYKSRFTGLVLQNPPAWQVRFIGTFHHGDVPEPIQGRAP